MQLPSATTPVSKCRELSLFTSAMLAKFPERAALAGLGAKLSGLAGVLVAAEQAFDTAADALVAARVGLRHADLWLSCTFSGRAAKQNAA